MIPGSLARRYARALIGLASSDMQRDKFAKDLDAFAKVCRSPDSYGVVVLSVLASERYTLTDRKKLIDGFMRRLGADPMVGKFLHYMLERDRIEGIDEVARAYRRMADLAAGRVNVEIRSAAPLAPDALAQIKQSLEAATGKKVVATTQVDPELIGGVVTKVGSYVIDGSVRAALDQLKTSLRN